MKSDDDAVASAGFLVLPIVGYAVFEKASSRIFSMLEHFATNTVLPILEALFHIGSFALALAAAAFVLWKLSRSTFDYISKHRIIERGAL